MFNIFKKKLLIVRIDAIGDYVLFRNYLEHIKKFYNDTLCCERLPQNEYPCKNLFKSRL